MCWHETMHALRNAHKLIKLQEPDCSLREDRSHRQRESGHNVRRWSGRGLKRLYLVVGGRSGTVKVGHSTYVSAGNLGAGTQHLWSPGTGLYNDAAASEGLENHVA